MAFKGLCTAAAFGLALLGCEGKPVDTFYAHERPAQAATVRAGDEVVLTQINDYVPMNGEKSDFDVALPGTDPRAIYAIVPGPTRVSLVYRGIKAPPNANMMTGGGYVVYQPGGTGNTSEMKTVHFTALPGHRYAVTAERNFTLIPAGMTTAAADVWDVRVKDRDTDALVAATYDREKKPTTAPAGK